MYQWSPMLYGGPPAQLAATASTNSTPLWRSNTTGSPVWASTATISTARCGQCWLGNRAATVARHRVCPEPSDAASISSAAAPSLRRISAASSAAAMISLVLRIWSAAGPMRTRPPSDPTGPVPCWGAAERMAASSSVGVALVIWAAAVDPADVPMIRSASVTSNPASNRPAMTPINHALPVDPPPPRTNARSPAAGARLVAPTCGWSDLGRSEAIVEVTCRGEEGVVLMGAASRELPGGALPGRDYLSRAIVNCGGAPTADTAFMGLTSCRWITVAGTIARRRRGAQPESCPLPCRSNAPPTPGHGPLGDALARWPKGRLVVVEPPR